jgi:glutamyl-tRNA synthetase
MSAVLTVPVKHTPFPWGATALAAYTDVAAIDFENVADAVSLDLNGQSASDEDEIIQLLAKAANLASDSAQVRCNGIFIPYRGLK